MLRIDKAKEQAADLVVRNLDERNRTGGVRTLLQRLNEGLGGDAAVDLKELALFQFQGVVDEQIGEPIEPFVTHTGTSLCTLRYII